MKPQILLVLSGAGLGFFLGHFCGIHYYTWQYWVIFGITAVNACILKANLK